MKASNIHIKQFITLLYKIIETGNIMIDLEILKKDGNDVLVIHPVSVVEDQEVDSENNNTLPNAEVKDSRQSDITISDPRISTEDDSIFQMFNGIS